MADMFAMDDKELKKYIAVMKAMPRIAARAIAFTLTGFAMGTDRHAKQVINRKMTIRNKKFIYGSIKTIFARPNHAIDKMHSIVGSVKRTRYSGLEEQETGKRPKRNRTFTRAARDGVKTRQVKGWARLKANAKYPSPSNASSLTSARAGRKDFSLKGLSGKQRIVAFLSLLNEQKKAQTFLIKRKFGRFKRGLYRFKQGVIKKLQSFDNNKKPKRTRWLTMGRIQYRKSINVSGVYNKNLRNEMRKRK